jgi:hypothetical protein
MVRVCLHSCAATQLRGSLIKRAWIRAKDFHKHLLPSQGSWRGSSHCIWYMPACKSTACIIILTPCMTLSRHVCCWYLFCSDCLRYELHGQGLDVVCIKPGAVKTDIWSRGHASSNTLLEGMPPVVNQLYGKLIGQVRERMVATCWWLSACSFV